jgi:hypothetical protein
MHTLPRFDHATSDFYYFGLNGTHYLVFCKNKLDPILTSTNPQSVLISTTPFKGSKRVKLQTREAWIGGISLDYITIAQGEFSVIEPVFAALAHFFPGKTTLYFRFNY